MILTNTFLLKRLLFAAAIAIVAFGVSVDICHAQNGTEATTYTNADREKITAYFGEVQERYVKTIGALSARQLAFRPNQKSWSVGQAAEHILIAETAIRGLIEQGPLKAALNSDPNAFRVSDLTIRLAVTNRGQKFNAPPAVQPKAEVTTSEALVAGFKEARAANVDLLKNTKADLRNLFSANPLLGTIDGYQWFLFLNGHTERHLAQIDEIMAHRDFPR